jgi:hypothetical protein
MTNPSIQKKINELLLDIEWKESIPDMKRIVKQAMEDHFDSFVESYEEVYSDEAAADDLKYMDESPAMYSWDEVVKVTVLLNESNLLCIQQEMYQYTGGAHGNYGYGFSTFDLNTGEQLSMDNLFKPDFRPELTALAEQQLRKKYNLTPAASLGEAGFFVESLELNDNFYINHGGIGFVYNPYEIASYADGAIDIFLSWEEVQALINTRGPLAGLMK